VSGDAHISWPELIQFKRTFTDPVPATGRRRSRKLRSRPIMARAVREPGEAVGSWPSARGAALRGRRRSQARHLGIPGEEHLLTSTAFLELDQLPGRIASLVQDYISFEFAHVSGGPAQGGPSSAEGSATAFEQDLVTRLIDHTRSLGIELRLDTEVTGLEKRGGGYRLRLDAQGRSEAIDADLVIHGGGREPNTEAST